MIIIKEELNKAFIQKSVANYKILPCLFQQERSAINNVESKRNWIRVETSHVTVRNNTEI